MSRLSKRQQRELQELEQLKAQEKGLEVVVGAEEVEDEDENPDEEEEDVAGPANSFAAVSRSTLVTDRS